MRATHKGAKTNTTMISTMIRGLQLLASILNMAKAVTREYHACFLKSVKIADQSADQNLDVVAMIPKKSLRPLAISP